MGGDKGEILLPYPPCPPYSPTPPLTFMDGRQFHH